MVRISDIELCRDIEHIHLLVYDGAGQDVVPRSIQLVAGRSGQEYNERKRRKGAFWQDL